MLCRVGKFCGSGSHAAIEYKLPYDEYFELFVKAIINPYDLELSQGNSIYPFYFLNEQNFLSVAAGIHRSENNILQARLIAKDSSGDIIYSKIRGNNNELSIQKWQRWSLVIRRVYTRETTAALYLGGKNNSAPSEVSTISYDSRSYNPKKLRVGIGFCSPNASGTIFTDNVRLSGRV